MTDNQSISDDDFTNDGPTEGEDDRDLGAEHGRDTGDESDEPTEADENLDSGGEGPRDTGDE